MKYRLAKNALELKGQPMFNVLARVKDMERAGKDFVHFEIGDPDFSTPKNIVDAAVTSLEHGETHYQSSWGMHEFRTLVCDVTEKSRGFRPDLDQVLIAPGANILIYYAVRCLVNPGDEVIVPDPGFPTYYGVIDFCGAKAVRVPLLEKNEFRMSPEDVRSRITEKTRLIIMNSPQNPTGSVMTPKEIEEIANIAKEKDIFIYSDEIYSRMMFEGGSSFRSPSFLDHCKERTIVANGFSKAFAMTGWRVGAVIGPVDVIEKMSLLLNLTSSCVPPFVQRGAMEAISGDQSAVVVMMEEYKSRRDLLVKGLNEISGVSCLTPGGSFYVFPNITKTGLTSDEFAELMIHHGVSLLAGNNFGQYGEGYVRLCYATSKERIIEGLKRIRLALETK